MPYFNLILQATARRQKTRSSVMEKMTKENGFTLIELMIGVAIVGILAAIAIPAYSKYSISSRLAEVMTAGRACQLAVEDYVLAGDSLNALQGNHPLCAKLVTPKISSITFTTYYGNCVTMKLALSDQFGSGLSGKILSYNRACSNAPGGTWQCGRSDGGFGQTSGELRRYLPSSCQG